MDKRDNTIKQLEIDVRRLKEDNIRLKNQLDDKATPMSDDQVDSIIAVIVILCISIAVAFWLESMPG